MRKKFLLPVFAIVFAISGAYASNKLIPAFYPAGDDDCNATAIPRPCPSGDDEVCTGAGDQPHYWKADVSDPESECQVLLREAQAK
ncbi:MAG: hypothetical protein EOO01_02380 [Chitinophagaceae bacterium]|nr:MAG: hypothetical protein EOO01_02380 [Chitinophagaceae bacterium]